MTLVTPIANLDLFPVAVCNSLPTPQLVAGSPTVLPCSPIKTRQRGPDRLFCRAVTSMESGTNGARQFYRIRLLP